MKKTIALVLVFCSTQMCEAQTLVNIRQSSPLSLTPGSKEKEKEEKDSKLDSVPFDLGTATFSTADKKIELNYYGYFIPKKFTHFFIAVTAGGAAKNSIASIFSNRNLVSEGNATLNTGFLLWHNKADWESILRGSTDPEVVEYAMKNYTRPAKDLWFVLNAEITGSSFKLYYPDSFFGKQIQKQQFTGREINAGLNYWTARMFGSTVLAGGTIGIKRMNNFDDLDESTREDIKSEFDSASGTQRRIILKETVYQGKYEESTLFPINIDVYFVPHKLQNIGFLFYSTTNMNEFALPKTKVGAGVFFLKNKNAFNPVAGLAFDYADVFNNDKSDDYKGQLSKFKIALTTRINIVNRQRK